MGKNDALHEIDVQLKQVNDDLHRLHIQRETLLALRSKLVSRGTPRGTARVQASHHGTAKLGPSHGVINLLAKEPGLTPTEIANRLEGEVSTHARNVRRTILTTINNLTHRGRLRVQNGKVFLHESAPELALIREG